MSVQPLLINGQWRPSTGTELFQAVDPSTKQPLAEQFPISPWAEIEQVIRCSAEAAALVRDWPGERFAAFLEDYATRIEGRAADIIAIAHRETGLAVEPRLKTAELPRTVNQLRQAATCARDGSWATATIDTKSNIRAQFGPMGPVVVFGPNNFPYAYNGIAGGDATLPEHVVQVHAAQELRDAPLGELGDEIADGEHHRRPEERGHVLPQALQALAESVEEVHGVSCRGWSGLERVAQQRVAPRRARRCGDRAQRIEGDPSQRRGAARVAARLQEALAHRDAADRPERRETQRQ